MHMRDFDYELPEERIAQAPPVVRGASKLLVLNRRNGHMSHKRYADMVGYLTAGDVVVLNDTKVIKARLQAINALGKTRELLLLEQHGHDFGRHHHKGLHRGRLHEGEILRVDGYELMVEKLSGGGIAEISSEVDLLKLSDKYGSVPLPPYMKRAATEDDVRRYQTEFAKQPGSVAAPTASLNFTHKLETALQAKGVTIAYLTLHVGLGTFLPIRTDKVEKHKMHSEYFEVPQATVRAIQNAKQSGNKILAVGTTVTRTLEYCAEQILSTSAQNFAGEADIFIYPPYRFKIVDKLVTNFHAPRTTVLMLTAAFTGPDRLRKAYQEALQHDYRFLSYGDSMLII